MVYYEMGAVDYIIMEYIGRPVRSTHAYMAIFLYFSEITHVKRARRTRAVTRQKVCL